MPLYLYIFCEQILLPLQRRSQGFRKGGAKYYARKAHANFDHAPLLNVKVKLHNELESTF